MNKERAKRKRIFYVPGMISLVLIPLFCFYHFYKVDAFTVYGGLNVGISLNNEFEEYKVLTLRKYKEFNFDGDSSEYKRLNEMKLFLAKLRAEKDTINGVKIHFGTKSTYQTFFSSIDILLTENAPTWIQHQNDIYVLGASNTPKKVKKDTTSVLMSCGLGESMRQQAYFDAKHKREEEAYQFQAAFVKEKWKFISLGFIGLILLNIFVLVKLNRQRYS